MMDRKQKIMRLIIDLLIENEHLEFDYTGSTMSTDPSTILLAFSLKKNHVRGSVSVRGMIDVPLMLKAQYDSQSTLNDYPEIRHEVDQHLAEISAKVNRIL